MTYHLFKLGIGDSSQQKSVCEWELMAIVMAGQKGRPYLLGQKLMVITDQKSQKILLKHVVSREHQKWIANLSDYGFDILY